ncbi:ABC transporter permease [Schaalia sp. 19OD2882]|uniref:ABC transporter permease n=1 Tax=Schaalia sp. 19OD2882 TaxID=2794089 RepID=UPI001C1ED83E|nr:ABC transporter permease [Schaalia sp. 19OD2882]QWW19068.1 ABC transporter permease [Schaalia sp. 19OD2882]
MVLVPHPDAAAPRRHRGGKILSAILLGVPAVLGVFISGVVVNHVPLDPAHLAMALGVVVVGSTVFAALGVVIGLVTRQESSYAAAMTVLMLFSIVGGLWMPREMMPDWLAAITTWTPSFQIADTGKAIMSGLSAAPVQAGAVFTVWTALFVALALVAFRRSASSR